MATPQIILRLLDNPGANRVQMNVASQHMQIAIRINQHRLVPPLEKMTGTFPAPVDPLCVSKTEILKNSGKRYPAHLNGKMDVVAHQAKGMNAVAKPLDPFLDKEGKPSPCFITIENDLARVAPQDDVI